MASDVSEVTLNVCVSDQAKHTNTCCAHSVLLICDLSKEELAIKRSSRYVLLFLAITCLWSRDQTDSTDDFVYTANLRIFSTPFA